MTESAERLEASLARARRIAVASGSSFVLSFRLLPAEQRRGMDALYAAARRLDDLGDDPLLDRGGRWLASWRSWLERGGGRLQADPAIDPELLHLEPALSWLFERFELPPARLLDCLAGVEADAAGIARLEDWPAVERYCYQVAGAIGLACIHIWGCRDMAAITPAAIACGEAFQLTNILRDVRGDAAQGRVYLPLQLLEQFGVERDRWLAGEPNGGWLMMLTSVVARARRQFDFGWQVHSQIDRSGRRMFGLMWSTYRRLLERVAADLGQTWCRSAPVRLSRFSKLRLAWQHFGPGSAARRPDRYRPVVIPRLSLNEAQRRVREQSVVVVGGGLAGIAAAAGLKLSGFERVTLLEARRRLGGRVGSFHDPQTGQAIDYCQHVGMQCCTNLRALIAMLDQAKQWQPQADLYFYHRAGRPIQLSPRRWPPPLHLSRLLLGWPGLTAGQRVEIAWGLMALARRGCRPDDHRQLAEPWLKAHWQRAATRRDFWETILISALGERLSRVSLAAARQVLVEGFMGHREAYQLLVPRRPLEDLLGRQPQHWLQRLGVEVRLQQTVDGLRWDAGRVSAVELSSGELIAADQVVLAVPWHRLSWLLVPAAVADAAAPLETCGGAAAVRVAAERAAALEGSPITGVHTWWSQPWLPTPHAILVNRLCQWVFPGPDGGSDGDASARSGGAYYQVVISGSRELPAGGAAAVLAAVEAELRELFPQLAGCQLLRGKVVTDPRAVFSLSPQAAAGRLPVDSLATQGVWVCGDWSASGWPATMEGAIRSGWLVCQQLARRHSLPDWLPQPGLPTQGLMNILSRSPGQVDEVRQSISMEDTIPLNII
jgi:squalene-associated FAD-dependent desaturase